MSSENQIHQKIFCVFKTSLDSDYQIPPTPITTNINSTNIDLNSVLKKLLKINKKKFEENFDFLLNGELIKGNLKSYMMKQKLKGEKNITLYYIHSL